MSLLRLTPLLFILLASAQDTGSLPLTHTEQVELELFIFKIEKANRLASDAMLEYQKQLGEANRLVAQRTAFTNGILRARDLPTDKYFVSESTRTIELVNAPTPRPPVNP